MVFLYIIAGITAFVALILSLNLSVRVIFDSSAKENMRVYAKIGFYKIHIIPEKQKKAKKPKKQKPKKPRQKPPKPTEPKEKEKEQKKYAIGEIFGLIQDMGLALLKRFKKHFRVRIYRIDVVLAAEDAEKTALLYGGAIQSAYYLHEFLERNFKIRKKPHSIKIIPDFSKSETFFDIDIKFYMRLSHMAALGLSSLIKFLKFWKKPKKI